MMNVLYEGFDTFADLPFAQSNADALLPRDFVPSKGLAKHCHKRSVSRKKNGVRWFVRVSPLGRHIQTNERLACSWNAVA